MKANLKNSYGSINDDDDADENGQTKRKNYQTNSIRQLLIEDTHTATQTNILLFAN